MKSVGQKQAVSFRSFLTAMSPSAMGSGLNFQVCDQPRRVPAPLTVMLSFLAGSLVYCAGSLLYCDGSLATELAYPPFNQVVYFTPNNSRLQNKGLRYSFSSSGTTMRFEVRPGDQPSFDSSSVERSEISSGKEIEFGKIYTLSYKFMVEPGAELTSRWMLLGQIHHRNDPGESGGSPPFAIEVNGEIIRVIARSSTNEIRVSNASAKTLWKDDHPLERGRWYSMKFDLRFDPFGNGLVHMWIDGVQKLRYNGPIGYNDKEGGYLKIGIYRSAAPETVAVQYDGVELVQAAMASAMPSETVGIKPLREESSPIGAH
jgi:hypothetical protein